MSLVENDYKDFATSFYPSPTVRYFDETKDMYTYLIEVGKKEGKAHITRPGGLYRVEVRWQ